MRRNQDYIIATANLSTVYKGTHEECKRFCKKPLRNFKRLYVFKKCYFGNGKDVEIQFNKNRTF